MLPTLYYHNVLFSAFCWVETGLRSAHFSDVLT